MSAPRSARTLTVLLASCLALAVLAQPASATAPGRNGRIAFKRYLGPDRTSGAIFTVAPGGFGERQLTTPPAGGSDDFADNASDGSFVAFQRCFDFCQIAIVRSGGGAPVAVTPGCPPGGAPPACTDDYYPAISPDTREIAFVRGSGPFDADDNIEHAAIWIMRADGRHARALTQPRSRVQEDNEVQWAPDGRRLVFTRVILATQQHAVFTIRADGTGLRQLTPYSLDAGDGPDWSPDGSRILFRIHESQDFLNSNLATIRPDGSGFRLLTHVPPTRMVLSASYSPDGRFVTAALGGLGGLPDVFVMRADGTGERHVTGTPDWDSAPDWGPRARRHHHH
jgi:TolB protein